MKRENYRKGAAIPHAVRLEVWKRADGRCEIRLSGCAGVGTDPHHRKLRSRGGSNEARNILLACRPCHETVTSPALPKDTARFRTFAWQPEGTGEDGVEWQPVQRVG